MRKQSEQKIDHRHEECTGNQSGIHSYKMFKTGKHQPKNIPESVDEGFKNGWKDIDQYRKNVEGGEQVVNCFHGFKFLSKLIRQCFFGNYFSVNHRKRVVEFRKVEDKCRNAGIQKCRNSDNVNKVRDVGIHVIFVEQQLLHFILKCNTSEMFQWYFRSLFFFHIPMHILRSQRVFRN